MKSTNRATEFSKDLRNALESHKDFAKKISVHKWVKNWSLPNYGETVDVAGLRRDDRPVILIEVELLREDPASNVVKIWKWAKDKRVSGAFVLIHAFSKMYQRSKKERKKEQSFSGSAW